MKRLQEDIQLHQVVLIIFFSYKTEIDNNRPLAVKFDKYFTLFEPNADYAYDYHWTPGLGYIYASTGTMLRVQTLAPNSTIRDINYNVNSAIISMVSFSINNLIVLL